LSSFRMGAAMSIVVRGMMRDDLMAVIRCHATILETSTSGIEPARSKAAGAPPTVTRGPSGAEGGRGRSMG
jgi:hypothetical protein